MSEMNTFEVDLNDVIADIREENVLLRKERSELQSTVVEMNLKLDTVIKAYDDICFQRLVGQTQKDEVIKTAHMNMAHLREVFSADITTLKCRINDLVQKETTLRTKLIQRKRAYNAYVLQLKCRVLELEGVGATTCASNSSCSESGRRSSA